MNQNLYLPNGEWVTILTINGVKWYNSIRSKLYVTYVIIYLLIVINFLIIFRNSIELYFVGQKVNEVKRYGNYLASDVSVNGYISSISGQSYKEVESEINNMSRLYNARVLVIDKTGIVLNDSFGIKIGKFFATKEVMNALGGHDEVMIIKDNGLVNTFTSINNYTTQKVEGVVFISFPINSVYERVNRVSTILVYILLVVGIALSFVLLFITKRYTRPLNSLLNGIKDVSNGHLNHKIEIKRKDELAVIGNAINQMTSKLLEIDNTRKEFVSNVSHELKTPLSSIKVLTESLLIQDNVSPEMYREFLLDINSEIDRQNAIINDLLTLVRFDEKEKVLNIVSISLNELVEHILKRLHPLAEKKNVELILESIRDVIVEADEMKLTLTLSNLIENGIKYNKENGRVTAKVDADHENAYISVIDTGIGIPREHFDRVFERFYRVDKTRDRATGGTGLGLSIAHRSILLHKGSISIDSEPNLGTKFIVTIPLKQNI